MKTKYINIILIVAALLILLMPPTTDAQVMADYTAYPPFVTSSVAPNILLVLDHSGSMQFSAFHDCTPFLGYSSGRASCGSANSITEPDHIYVPLNDYYGYFETDKYYQYSSNKFIENSSCTFTSAQSGYRVGNSNTCISGNFLNWATMTRTDLLRKALIGGKSVASTGTTHTLRSEGGWWTYSDHTTGCTINLSGGSYPSLDHRLTISNYSSSGMLTVRGTGNQIWGTSDGFRYVYQSANGNFDIRLHITSPPHESAQTYAKAGLMIRASTAANSQHVKAMATYGAGLQFSQRATNGASTTLIGSYVSRSYPEWVRIRRSGNTFTFYYSNSNGSWTTHGSTTVAMPANVLVGMASSAYSNTVIGTAEYDEFDCSSGACTDDDFGDGSLNAVWTAVDINTAIAGTQTESTNSCAVGTLANARVSVEVPNSERSGIVQDISDIDGDGVFDPNSPRFGLMVYASNSRYGCIRSGIANANMSTLITALQNEVAYYGTPSGEAFNEAWDYFIQSNDHGGCDNSAYIGGVTSSEDPWCDSGNAVACRKSYVLHISDGEWNGSVDPVRPARSSHAYDIRTDSGMDGTQSLKFYNVYTFSDSTAGINAMQQASMYGAFDDYDGNLWPYDRTGYPASSKTATLPAAPCDPSSLPMNGNCSEWDKNDDGLPDTYYEASDGDALEAALVEAVTDILKHASSGTAVSVLATTGEGEGAIYQAFFFPQKLEGVEPRKWLGYVHSLMVDKYGNLREDTNGNKALDMTTDLIIEMDYSIALGSFANKYLDADADGVRDSASPTATVPLENLNTLWNGGTILWSTPPASRTIFTSIDGFNTVDFTTANQAALMPYLRAADASESQNIINWTRGDDLSGITDAGHASGYRPRDLTINGVSDIWKLGDIVNSTPSIVARPMENFDLLYGDSTYSEYRLTHLKRRQMVYTGANDGMLHAFNAGCFDAYAHQYFPDVDASGNCASLGHTLGEELWAFIPRGILPHLKWNTDPDYTHVYSVDSKPKISDIKVFTANAAHSKGWGTILIGGFRYGGKDISWTSGGTSYSASPEYYALDVTDPINPRLLWTFSDPDLGLSMSYPAITKIGDTWYAIFGSGATDYDDRSNLTTFQAGYLYVLDISSGSNGVIDTWTLNTNFWKISTGNATSFMADPISVDVDIDFDVDIMYFGENYRQGGTWNALMHRITTGGGSLAPSSWTISTLGNINSIAGSNDVSKRITAAPSAAMDDRANLWLFFGTGQFLGMNDKNQVDSGAFYAIKDKCWDGSCTTTYSNLIDVSTATVTSTGQVAGITGGCGAGSSSWGNLLTASYSCDGWAMYFDNIGEDFDFTGSQLTHTGERMLSKPLVLGGLVTFATYIPGIDQCSFEGESNIYAVYYETGTAFNEYVFKEQKEDATPSNTVARVRKLGAGMPSSLSAQITAGGTAKGFVQQSTGSILEIESITPLSLQSGVTGWRNQAIQ